MQLPDVEVQNGKYCSGGEVTAKYERHINKSLTDIN